MTNKIIIIYGPTASGKSSLALKIAKEFDAVIINADSIQVYEDLCILSARPTQADEQQAPHRLYGFVGTDEKMTVAKWLNLAVKEIKRCHHNNKLPILVGGTGMYLGALLDGLSEVPQPSQKVLEQIDLDYKNHGLTFLYDQLTKLDPTSKIKSNDSSRIMRALAVLKETGKPLSYWNSNNKKHFKDEQFICLSIIPDKKQVDKLIAQRSKQMFADGAIDEVKKIMPKLSAANSLKNSLAKSIGVAEIIAYLNEQISLDDAIEQTIIKTRQYAKRQLTWARNKMPASTVNCYGKDFEQIILAIKDGNKT